MCFFLGDSSCKPRYKVNEELNKKISLFSGDIRKLEIDAVANAGEKRRTGKFIVYITWSAKQFYCFPSSLRLCLAVYHKLKTQIQQFIVKIFFAQRVLVIFFFFVINCFSIIARVIFVENMQCAGGFGIVEL